VSKKAPKETRTAQEVVDSIVRFEVERIDRSAIKKAPYNPRVIDDVARSKLSDILGSNGLVEPLVWNRRTGVLVSGHQRLSILDQRAGSKDYTLPVSVVDVDEVAEAELNIALNNPDAQGEFTIEGLAAMFKAQPGISMRKLGMDEADKFRLLGNDPNALEANEAEVLAEKLAESRRQQDEILANSEGRDTAEFYLVLVGRDSEDVLDFLRQARAAAGETAFPDNRFHDLRAVRRLLGWPDPRDAEFQ